MTSHTPTFSHQPVMAAEVMAQLAITPGATAVDVTAGGGGHLRLIAEAVGAKGHVLAFDRDLRAHQEDAAMRVVKDYQPRVRMFHAAFSSLESTLESEGIQGVDALLCDLGVSSPQLDDAGRGFSFMREGPLDMRMDTSRGETAHELISRLSETELADVIYHYGEERFSRKIAKVIKEAWPLPDSTLALANLIAEKIGRREKIHPATRTFQGLRIAVNRELDELDTLLEALPRIIKKGGRAVIISFHSLEDRKVKQAFKALSYHAKGETSAWRLPHKKPLEATREELRANSRARSAKLRTIEHIGEVQI